MIVNDTKQYFSSNDTGKITSYVHFLIYVYM